MKKIASLFLLGILLFNWIGYQLVTGYWRERAKTDLEARLDDDDYDGSQLISIKLPATHLAYYNSSPQFERVNGSLELNGVVYKYVKRRLYNDTLEWLCLPDQGAMKLRASAHKIFDIPLKCFNDDPYVLTAGFVSRTPFVLISPLFGDASFSIPCTTPGTDEQPPDGLA